MLKGSGRVTQFLCRIHRKKHMHKIESRKSLPTDRTKFSDKNNTDRYYFNFFSSSALFLLL
jgi:hypothetical protein